MANLLREFIKLSYDKQKIVEAKEQNKPIILTGIIQRCNEVNQNKRIYPKTILEREIENYKKIVADGRALGELDHPESSVVELKNASHIVREVWWNGNEVYGKVEVLNTPAGRIVQDLLSSGISVGISSRGVGETKKSNEGYDEVCEDFILICFDLVSEPSTQNAFLFKEGKQINMSDVRKLVSKIDRVNRVANEILKK